MKGFILFLFFLPALAQPLGVNYWREDPPPAVAERVRGLGVGWLRVGGHYRDTTPYTRFDLLWLKEFMERAGVREAVVQLPFLGSDPAGTEAQARLVLAYLKPRAFLIGNEPDLYREGLGDWTPEAYAVAWRARAERVRRVAPGVPLFGPGLSAFKPDWLKAFLERNGDLVEAVALHRYPFDGGQDLEALLGDALGVKAWLQGVKALVRATLGRDLPLVLGEFNSSWNWRGEGPYGPSSPWNALYTALLLGAFLEEGVLGAFYWSLFDDGPLALLDGLARPRPAYYALLAFRGYRALRPLSCPAPLRGFLRQDGQALVLVNPGPEPRACAGLEVPGYGLLARGEVNLLLTPTGFHIKEEQ